MTDRTNPGSPYREPSDIAAEIPPAPREPYWTVGRQIIAAVAIGVVLIEAGIVMLRWGRIDLSDVGAWMLMHGVAGPFAFILWRTFPR